MTGRDAPLATPPTVFVPRGATVGSTVSLGPDDARHLHVLRLAPGASIRGVDGEGMVYALTLHALDRRTARALVEESRASACEPRVRLWIVQATLHTARMDWLVEKAAEIGVSGIAVARSERSQRAASPQHVERWRRIARAATLQSMGARIPSIESRSSVKEAIESAGAEAVVLADPEGGPARPERGEAPSSVVLVVGPEGGFTGPERADLIASGARPVSLGRRRFRAETAAIVLAASLVASADTRESA